MGRVRQRLNAQIEPVKIFRNPWSDNHLLYEGKLSDQGFDINRIIHNRNSFLPRIQGRFDQLPDKGTAIYITLSYCPSVRWFIGLWSSSWFALFLLGALFGDLSWQEALMFFAVPLLGLLMFSGYFWMEARRDRREISSVILGTYSNPV